MKNLLSNFQKLGKAIMLPMASLPAAALLLRLGAEDVFNIPFINAAGAAIFDNLPILFAIGIAVGLASDGSGAAGLAGAVGYFILTKSTNVINSTINMDVLGGIIVGITAGILYNRFYNIQLPDYLGFFGGKRFVPIITGVVCVLLAGIFGYIWPPIQNVISALGNWIIGAGALGVAIYGILNRLLIPFGLHHVLNNLILFIFGEYTTPAGEVIRGDLSRFFAGDPTAGVFTAGSYLFMMFGLPAVALAMYRTAKPENKEAVKGIMISVALTAFLTGITEPIEFSFMFLAPALYFLYALLCGGCMVVTYLLGIKHSFAFSAGAIDYFLNYGLATKPFLIIPLGVITFFVYYLIFVFFIKKFNLATPGRLSSEMDNTVMEIMPEAQKSKKSKLDDKARTYITYLGGAENIESVGACITRLRLVLKDTDKINENGLKQLGSTGIMRLTKKDIQVVVGTKAEIIADKIKKELKEMNNN